MSRPALLFLSVIPACAALSACSPTIRKPQLLHPGPAPYQRANAEVYDPYPIPDLGPDIVGGRPRDFQKPRNEVERAQDFLRSAGARPAQEVARNPVPVAAPITVGPAVPVGQPVPTFPATQPFPVTPSGPRY
jgi:hypothetical protein